MIFVLSSSGGHTPEKKKHTPGLIVRVFYLTLKTRLFTFIYPYQHKMPEKPHNLWKELKRRKVFREAFLHLEAAKKAVDSQKE